MRIGRLSSLLSSCLLLAEIAAVLATAADSTEPQPPSPSSGTIGNWQIGHKSPIKKYFKKIC
jgi:invasion protein IalB